MPLMPQGYVGKSCPNVACAQHNVPCSTGLDACDVCGTALVTTQPARRSPKMLIGLLVFVLAGWALLSWLEGPEDAMIAPRHMAKQAAAPSGMRAQARGAGALQKQPAGSSLDSSGH